MWLQNHISCLLNKNDTFIQIFFNSWPKGSSEAYIDYSGRENEVSGVVKSCQLRLVTCDPIICIDSCCQTKCSTFPVSNGFEYHEYSEEESRYLRKTFWKDYPKGYLESRILGLEFYTGKLFQTKTYSFNMFMKIFPK